MSPRVLKLAPLLVGSGCCALVYQTAWLRELRLVFGASTLANAAVVAIFMGGLGLGGVLLGRRADRTERPLLLYARLEFLVALTAAVTPFLVWLAHRVYAGLGGTVVLGEGGGTVARLLLSAVVLGVPAVLMGGTLPAITAAAMTDDDPRRRSTAVLYASNTLGAVLGASLSTFFLLEAFGTRTTLWLACLVNAVVAVVARAMAREMAPVPVAPDSPPPAPVPADAGSAPALPSWWVLLASGVVGFVFLLMELVWYRMLAPLLGGSSYTFGLILAVALLGIGVGGAAYSAWGSNRPATIRGFALTCALEALCLAAPYALGDRVAWLALLLRPMGSLGLEGSVVGWGLVAGLVVFPAAVVSGFQFPLLINLLGRGRHAVGRHVGTAYAWNTAGAIAGSLAGGFGLMPLLTAPGCWVAATWLLGALALVSVVMSVTRERRWAMAMVACGTAVTALTLLAADGPSAAWRHGSIGAGRAMLMEPTPNAVRAWAQGKRGHVVWEQDGVESSVALSAVDGLAFILNGKIDGNARGDAATQVMAGLVGAILHPAPRTSLVVGLGTGSTAGWLAAAPGVERVDVVELEPAILHVARACAPVNQDALSNPRVHVILGDAREVLLTTPARYDIIFSEPSNPYRAGIASLFTREFYRAAADRLRPGGIFLQWLQAYEVQPGTARTVLATLRSVFPEVATWQTKAGSDLLLVATMDPLPVDVARTRARIREEPFRSALAHGWRVRDLEGFLAHHVARPSLATAVAELEGEWLNTDDHTIVEFGFARVVGQLGLNVVEDMSAAARSRGEDRPVTVGGDVDWESVEDQRVSALVSESRAPGPPAGEDAARRDRAAALRAYLAGDRSAAANLWRRQPRPPRDPVELAVVADALAEVAAPEAEPLVEELRAFDPVEADVVLARLRWRQGRAADSVDALAAALTAFRTHPWPWPPLMAGALDVAFAVATEAAKTDRPLAERVLGLLAEPYAVSCQEYLRRERHLRLSVSLGPESRCAEAFGRLEPYVPWSREALAQRLSCYQAVGHPLAARADADMDTFLATEAVPFSAGLVVQPKTELKP